MLVTRAAAVLDALQRAIDDGLLTPVEDRIASDVYSDVCSEADVLLNGGHIACAAILTRVGLESGLKRRATRLGMPTVEKAKASAVNQWLWRTAQVYPKGTHDAVEGWLAIGNAFAHNSPEQSQYGARDIAKALADVQSFLGTLLV